MKYQRFGKTNWQISAVSMGCWGIGGQWGQVAENEAIRTIQEGIEAGINLLDTADSYGQGVSEELVGKAVQGRRRNVFIATKVGNFARRTGHPLSFQSPEHVYLCCDASLGRMGIDTIDLYQCHIGSLEDPSIFLEAFERLVEKGKVRQYGISTNSLSVLERFNQAGQCASCQINYSILNPSAAKDILPYCQANDIGTLIRGPIAQGVLAGTFTPSTTFDDQVRIGWNSGEGRERFLRQLALVEQIRFLENPNRTLAQAALQFVIAHPAVTAAIPGAKNVAQVRANALAADGALSAAEIARIQEVTPR